MHWKESYDRTILQGTCKDVLWADSLNKIAPVWVVRDCMACLYPASSISPSSSAAWRCPPRLGPLSSHIPGWPQVHVEPLSDPITKGTSLPCKKYVLSLASLFLDSLTLPAGGLSYLPCQIIPESQIITNEQVQF